MKAEKSQGEITSSLPQHHYHQCASVVPIPTVQLKSYPSLVTNERTHRSCRIFLFRRPPAFEILLRYCRCLPVSTTNCNRTRTIFCICVSLFVHPPTFHFCPLCLCAPASSASIVVCPMFVSYLERKRSVRSISRRDGVVDIKYLSTTPSSSKLSAFLVPEIYVAPNDTLV